jgi:hypothetical protein
MACGGSTELENFRIWYENLLSHACQMSSANFHFKHSLYGGVIPFSYGAKFFNWKNIVISS